MSQKKTLRPHQVAIIAAALVSLAAYITPVLNLIFLPLRYLNTHIHELCHALAATATGGDALFIKVFGNGSGVTPVGGGNLLLTASAGYVGAVLVGAGMVVVGRTPKAAALVLKGIAIAIAFSMVVWVRGDIIGVGSGIAWAVGLWLLAVFLNGPKVVFVAQLVGLQQCLNALQSVYALLQISTYPELQSDAKLLESAIGVPAMVWAVLWSAFAIVLVVLSLRKAWKESPGQAE